MSIKTILASLVLGSSSVAMAHPATTVTTNRANAVTVVRDHRVNNAYGAYGAYDDDGDDYRVIQPVVAPAYRRDGWNGRWNGEPKPAVYRPVMLAYNTHFGPAGRAELHIGGDVGRFTMLQISAARGSTFVEQVYVQFTDGQEQIISNISRPLAGNERLTLELDGGRRSILRVIVYSHSKAAVRWQVPGAFTLTAA